jgi:hypothetical protein
LTQNPFEKAPNSWVVRRLCRTKIANKIKHGLTTPWINVADGHFHKAAKGITEPARA